MQLTRFKTISGAAIIGASAVTFGAVTFIAGTGFAADPGSNSKPGASAPAGESLAKGSDCFSCHAVDQKVVGPSFKQVADRFASKPNAETTLVGAIKNGHVGTWGKIAMPAHAQLSDADTSKIVAWILAMKKGSAAASASGSGKKYSYTVNGKSVSTSFPIYKPGSKSVTPAIFTGYEQFNSYCFRCHGEDAVGGSYAPNLRRSVNNGMTESQFLSVVMEGRKAKGMPSWAGFFSPQQVSDIYQYVKARAIKVVGIGTPHQ
jgi:cytochrome c